MIGKRHSRGWPSPYELPPGTSVSSNAGGREPNSRYRLLGTYQQNSDTTPIPQTDLYTSYALRFAAPSTDHPDQSTSEPTQTALTSLQQADDSFELADLDGGHNNLDPELDPQAPIVHHRLLSPVELITLTRMTFPQCEPAVDDDGKFVIRGLERRDGVEKGWTDKSQDMFPFALLSGKSTI